MPNGDVLQAHLRPNRGQTVAAILTDAERTSAVLLTASDAAILTQASAEILYQVFFGPGRRTLSAIVGRRPEQRKSARDWLADFTGDGVMRLDSDPPTRSRTRVTRVEPGEVVAPNPKAGRDDITVNQGGTLQARRVDESDVYWYESSASVRQADRLTHITTEGAVLTRGEIMGTSLLPRRVGNGGVGVNCVGCAVCAACGGCAVCAVCGPSPAAALGLVGVDTTLGVVAVAGSVLAAEMLRN